MFINYLYALIIMPLVTIKIYGQHNLNMLPSTERDKASDITKNCVHAAQHYEPPSTRHSNITLLHRANCNAITAVHMFADTMALVSCYKDKLHVAVKLELYSRPIGARGG
jgi:hypothetical protein